MSIFDLPRTYTNLKRLRQIALTLARHGFSHILERLRLSELLPGRDRYESDSPERSTMPAPERLARVFQELGATFIKLGQLLSTRPDLTPPAYARAFAKLQNEVAPTPMAEIHAIIRARLNANVGELFAEFAETPVACGSLGQVHEAVLNSGERVVVKIKRPGVEAMVREDLSLLGSLADKIEELLPELRVLRPRLIVEEFSRAMERELDFVGEAAHTARLARELGGDERLAVPLVYWDYATRDTLVLERLEGIKCSDPSLAAKPPAERRALAQLLSDCFMRQFFISGFFHADPHPGNLFILPDNRLAVIDCGQMGRLSEEMRRQLALIILALVEGDLDLVVDILAQLGACTDQTDLREFKGEFSMLMDRYYGIPVNRIDIGEAFLESVAVARRNGINLPREFVLLGKSFVTVIGVVQALDPDFRADEAARPFARQILASLLDPRSLAKGLSGYAYRVYSILSRAPEDLRDLLQKVRTGHLRIVFHHEGLENPTSALERAANRLVLALVFAALIVGSAIVLASGRAILGGHILPLVGDVPVTAIISAVGFAGTVLMGLGLAWVILRGRRF